MLVSLCLIILYRVCVCVQHSNSAAVYVITSECANYQLLGCSVCAWTSLFAVDRVCVCGWVGMFMYISTL